MRHMWGWVLVTLGVIGLILPIMPGWIFLIPGLVILSDYFPWAKRLLEWSKAKAGMGEKKAKRAGADSEDKYAGNSGGDRS